MNLFNYNFAGLLGSPVSMEQFRNQLVLLVNTASQCEFTPQYAQLQQIYLDYRDSGLNVLGIPCNDFGQQEPEDEEKIAEFVSSNYRVSFPMTAKYSVIGPQSHPLFKDIAQEYGGDVLPRWNFHKYLFGRRGELIEHWPSKVPPDDPAVINQITRHLQSWIL